MAGEGETKESERDDSSSFSFGDEFLNFVCFGGRCGVEVGCRRKEGA